VPFPQDIVHASYEPEWANRYWRTLVSVDTVLKEHRARFRGKAAPVGLFWGSLDLSYSRFSGRLLDPPPEAGVIARYSADAEEVCAGFWPGDGRVTEPAFFAYALPKPPDVESAELTPAAAEWRASMGEFILPYEAVRTAPDPRQTLLGFLETTYRAGTADGDWPPELAQPSEG
jgi:hypothetical protein